jgi:hypothetical protein
VRRDELRVTPLRAEIAEWDLRWPYAPAVRSRNSYLTVRRFSAQNRLGSIQALKRLKASATDRETGLAAAEIAVVWLLLTGNPGRWTVTNTPGETASGLGWRWPLPSGRPSQNNPHDALGGDAAAPRPRRSLRGKDPASLGRREEIRGMPHIGSAAPRAGERP